ncbi:phosphotransferase [Microbacterium sp. NPDC056234]|uniref:phosphotransferase n=1 Tax=Microbacterium sp. NPDC056234 TaxID=3345757 RepID=UPI0035DB803C
MLKLSEILRLRRTVDAAWRSPEADVAGAAWDLPAGAARFWRSSASHVFVVPSMAADERTAYLRFVPAGSVQADALTRAAAIMSAWADAGLSVARPLPSRHGRLTERILAEHGEIVAMLVPAAVGNELDLDELTDAAAADWGAALASLHTASSRFDDAQGSMGVHSTRARFPVADDELMRAAMEIEARIARLDASTHERGMIHGDFELDNLRFDDAGVTFFDTDEARVDWFAADVALATRDLAGVTLDSEPRPALLSAFLRGYRGTREFSAEAEASLPLFGAAASAALAFDLHEAIDLDERHGDPDWLVDLRTSLRRHLQWHRERALAFSAALA